MEKFSELTGIVACLELSNIDTDMIIPKQFLKTIKRSGLGKGLFYEMRFDENEKLIPEFILNKSPYNESKIPNLFSKLLKEKEHISLVVDEYGSVRGLVTLEDIIETMLGLEIVDETDTVEDLQLLAKNKSKELYKN